jgi:hypothetical protein
MIEICPDQRKESGRACDRIQEGITGHVVDELDVEHHDFLITFKPHGPKASEDSVAWIVVVNMGET